MKVTRLPLIGLIVTVMAMGFAAMATTPDTARLLSQAFGTTLQFWLNLQNQYE
jgi:plasmid maintenance system antidote protein VapI